MPTQEQINNIDWALQEYRKPVPGSSLSRLQLNALYRDYYEGRHKLTFATQKFKDTFGETFQAMAENLCPICVDSLADRLQIQGFTSANKADAKRVATETAEIERRNRMDQRRGSIYKDLFIYGETHTIVWPDPEDETQPVIYPNAPGSIVVKFDAQKVGLITQGAKFWVEGGKCRLNLYFPDRIEKYITSNKAAGLPAKATEFITFYEGDEPWPLPNRYGRVPIFAYINNAGVGQGGVSELRDVIPPQNALNKALCDMLVAMEFEAFAQRWVTGLQVEKDSDGKPIPPFKAGIDRVWHTLKEGAKFGEFTRANLEHFITVQNGLRASIARIIGFPLHYFMIGQDIPPSGASLIVASARFTSKVQDRQVSIGNTEADQMRFCLQIRGLANVDVVAEWKDTSPQLDEGTQWDAALKQAQLTGKAQALRDRGYTDAQIKVMQGEQFAEEWGDGAPDIIGPVATGDAASVEPGTAPDAGLSTTVTLNGTQLTSMKETLKELAQGLVTRLAAIELLSGAGIPRDRAEAVVDDTVANGSDIILAMERVGLIVTVEPDAAPDVIGPVPPNTPGVNA